VAAIASSGGRSGVWRRGIEAVSLGFFAGIGTLVASVYLIPELSGVVGGLAATVSFLGLRWRRLYGLEVPIRGLLPYAFLLALLTLTNGVESLVRSLEVLGPVFVGPGLPLLISCAFATLLFRLGRRDAGAAILDTFRQWLPTAGAVLTFVLAGQVVASSGAAALLASGAAALGGLYLTVAPVVGALGGWLTGSNAASNALFMPLQLEAARDLGAPETITAATQNVSGSYASLLSPQRIVLAATATGLLGREGDITRAALPPVLVSVAVLAGLGMLLS
jgi:lactate permease